VTWDKKLNDYRVIPRLLVVLWILLIYSAYSWYIDYEIVYKTQCDAKVLELLIEKGHKNPEAVACTTTEAIGRPNGYTVLLSTLFGAGTGIFGLYVNSGGRRNEDNSP
jgi:hypothetical protein